MKKLTKPDFSKLTGQKRLLAKVALGILLLIIIAIIVFALANRSSKDQANKKDPFTGLKSIQEAKDCNAGLAKLPDIEKNKPNLGRNEQTALSISTAQYKIDCNLELKKFDAALKATEELNKIYQIPETGATQIEKDDLANNINDIQDAKNAEEMRLRIQSARDKQPQN